jgi:hypothetical protein
MFAATYHITRYQAKHHGLSHSMYLHQETELKDHIYNCEQTHGTRETLRFSQQSMFNW